jgi:hypothetical protein
MSSSIMERANRIKLRFATSKGNLTTEDLWDLSLPSLDAIAKGVNKELKNEEEESFIPDTTPRPASTHNALRLEILKHVIVTKSEEMKAAELRATKRATLARLKELAANKADEAFNSLSREEIAAQIAALEAEV